MKGAWKLINLGLALVLCASVGVGGWYGWQWFSDDRENRERAEAVEAARAGVHTLYSVSVDSIDSDLARASEVLTGDLLELWQEQADNVKQAVIVNSSEQTADVRSAAYVEGTATTAKVLLAVDTTTDYGAPLPDPDDPDAEPLPECDPEADEDADEEECAEAQEPMTSYYRFDADLVKDDGEWLLAGLEVV